MKWNRWNVAVSLCLFTLFLGACSNTPEPTPEPEPVPEAAPQTFAPAPIEQIQGAAAGQIESIDAPTSMLTIKDSSGALQTFSYTEATEIVR